MMNMRDVSELPTNLSKMVGFNLVHFFILIHDNILAYHDIGT